jgi:Tfp pilus assembly protein PilP
MRMLTRVLLIGALALPALRCGGSSAPTSPPKTEPNKVAAAKKAAAEAKAEAQPDLLPNPKWDVLKEFFFTYADTPLPSVKNAFWSNMDKYMPRIDDEPVQTKPEEDTEEAAEITPLEKYPPEDYQLVMIIAGTAVPKAIMIDPDNRRHVVRKDNRLGNRNGVVDEITEFEVVVKEPYADKPVILSIKPAYIDWSKRFDYTGE